MQQSDAQLIQQVLQGEPGSIQFLSQEISKRGSRVGVAENR